MSPRWGGTDDVGRWSPLSWTWTLRLFLLALVVGAAVVRHQYLAAWTPLQRQYAKPYVWSAIKSRLTAAPGRYELLEIITRDGPRPALDVDVSVAMTPNGPSFQLSDAARAARAKTLRWSTFHLLHGDLHGLLRDYIYRGQTLTDLAAPGLWAALAIVCGGLGIVASSAGARARAGRPARSRAGPELMTPARFNRRMPADGLEIALAPSRGGRLARRSHVLRLPRASDGRHLLVMGESHTGRSAFIRQLLHQIAARGDTAVVYDPALEYAPQFFRSARGDLLLNPSDVRCPSWHPGDEVICSEDAAPLAAALAPADPYENEPCRQILERLLACRPTASDLAGWLCDEEDLVRRLPPDVQAATLRAGVGSRRERVLASLKIVVEALTLLPRPTQASLHWNTRRWATHRRGWLFISSTPETHERLRPVQTLWLDLLVLRLLTSPATGHARVWLVLDDLTSLSRLPQLHGALIRGHQPDATLVLGLQDRSRLDALYGHEAETLLSQPMTKVFFATSGAHGAHWMADTLGWRRPAPRFGLIRRPVEPLVWPDAISGLPPFHGYLKVQDGVVPFHIQETERSEVEPRLIERPVPPRIETPPPPSDSPALPFFR